MDISSPAIVNVFFKHLFFVHSKAGYIKDLVSLFIEGLSGALVLVS